VYTPVCHGLMPTAVFRQYEIDIATPHTCLSRPTITKRASFRHQRPMRFGPDDYEAWAKDKESCDHRQSLRLAEGPYKGPGVNSTTRSLSEG
jgi:hypothetical protein